MKAFPAFIVFLLVYYTLWLISLPVLLLRMFLNRLSGHDE